MNEIDDFWIGRDLYTGRGDYATTESRQVEHYVEARRDGICDGVVSRNPIHAPFQFVRPSAQPNN